MKTKEEAVDGFIARESQLINFLFAGIFFAMSIGGLLSVVSDRELLRQYWFILLALVFPGIYFLMNGIKRLVIFEINTTGISYKGKLITSWPHFINAYLISEDVRGMSEQFFVLVEYYVPEKQMSYQVKLKLSSAQDKSEDQVLAAIIEFYKKYQAGIGQ